MSHVSLSSVVPAPRRSRSASFPLRNFVNVSARCGAVAFGVFCGALTLAHQAPQAKADWVFDHYEQEGTSRYTREATLDKPSQPALDQSYTWPSLPDALPGTPPDMPPVGAGSSAYGVGATATLDGKFRVVYHWEIPDPDDTTADETYDPDPPAYVSFLISVWASGSAQAHTSGGPIAPLEFHGSKETASATAWGQEAPVVVAPFDNGTTSAGGLKTERVVAQVSGDTVKSPWVAVKARSEIKGGRYSTYQSSSDTSYSNVYLGNAGTCANAIFSVPDSRAVIITSALDDSYHKGTDGNGDPVRVRNKREDDQSMTVDGLSIGTPMPEGYAWRSTGSFSAIASGFQTAAPDLHYSWSGVNNSWSKDVSVDTMGGGPTALQVTVSDPADTSGFSISNRYTVNWHLPYERESTLPDGPPQKTPIRTLAGPLNPGDGVTMVGTPAEDFDLGAAIDDVTVLAGAAGLPEAGDAVELFRAVTGLANLIHSYGGTPAPTPANFWRNDDGTWVPATRNYPENISGAIPADLADPYGYSKFTLTMKEVKRWHHASWLADKYGQSGYVDSGHLFKADPVDGVEIQPYYTRIVGLP